VVTTTVTAPAAWAGVVAVIVLSLTTVIPVAAMPSNVTPVVLVRFVPVIVTNVPPNIEPETGMIPVNVGTPANDAAIV
jgi:hypothetical protein